MFGFTLFHHLGKSLERENLKSIIISGDITGARQKISELILEHDRYLNTDAPNDPRAQLENLMIHHADRHLETADVEENQKNAAVEALVNE